MARTLVNLTVHGIGPPPRPLDPGEERTWVSVEQFERVVDAAADRDDVRLTFDDGNVSDLEVALPRLLERGLTAEFFLAAGLLDQPGRLTADGVGELLKAGMPIGSHGWAHRDWRRLDDRQAVQEIDDARSMLAGLTNRQVLRVSIPFGSYDREVIARLRRAGITRAYTSDGGRARPDAWLQARNSLPHDLGPEWIDRVLRGQSSLAQRALKGAVRGVKRARPSPRGDRLCRKHGRSG